MNEPEQPAITPKSQLNIMQNQVELAKQKLKKPAVQGKAYSFDEQIKIKNKVANVDVSNPESYLDQFKDQANERSTQNQPDIMDAPVTIDYAKRFFF